MKKLMLMVLAVVSLQMVSAQEKGMGRMNDYSPEEMAELQTKRMTLALDLTKDQQTKIQAMNLEQAKERKAKMESFKKQREAGEKPSKEQRLAMENERLDKQIEMKAKMKSILNEEQYKKWETQMEERHQKMKEHQGKRKGGKRMAPEAPAEIED